MFKTIYYPLLLLFTLGQLGLANDNFQDPSLCNQLIDELMTNKLELKTDPAVTKSKVDRFWDKHHGDYYAGPFNNIARATFKEFKRLWMRFNRSSRPVYYIQNDNASYPKIFRYIELVSKSVKTEEETKENETLINEINTWISHYESYRQEMESLVMTVAINAQYIDLIENLKNDFKMAFPMTLILNTINDGRPVTTLYHVSTVEEFDTEIIYKMKQRNRNILGNLINGPGKILDRDKEQAILMERLKNLLNELQFFVVNNPKSADFFIEKIKKIQFLLNTPDLLPTQKSLTRLELNEANAEFAAAFETFKYDVSKIDDFAQSVIKNLSPYYQQQLKLDVAKEWASTLKKGKTGVLVTGYTSLASGGAFTIYKLAPVIADYFYYEEKSIHEISTSDDDKFDDQLKTYLSDNFDEALISRVVIDNKFKVTLKNYNPSIKVENKIVNFVQEVVNKRQIFKIKVQKSKEVSDQITKIIGKISTTANNVDSKK
jgi:hypothetical protein